MPTNHDHAERHLRRVLANCEVGELSKHLQPKPAPAPPQVPGGALVSEEAVAKRWQLLDAPQASQAALLDPQTRGQLDQFHHHIENFIGTVKVPVGMAGPLRVNGLFARGDFYVPMATTEAALVASYSRGAQAITEAGGCSVALLNEGVSRAPGFVFANLAEAGQFLVWAMPRLAEFKRVAESTTQHGKLNDMQFTVEGNHVYLGFEFLTGDAAGQNMVTIASEAICRYIVEQSPVKPRQWFVEANLSGDKKASALSFLTVRGRKVTAEVTLPAALVRRRLRTTPEQMSDYWRVSAIGGVLSGAMGVQGHYANGLAALYIACGQDAACVAESAVGVTRFELTGAGSLYAAVTLPSLIVGTVGGGTGLPSQRTCLELLGLAGAGKSQAFAEVCCALALAGELSIIAALSANQFTRAHQRLARDKRRAATPDDA
ncbi:MAG: hydroxymethylglutaryl-CoA reductase [Verrucomicrobiia bacterium]